MAKKIPTNLGFGGAGIPTELKPLLEEIVNSLNSLKAQVDDVQAKYNAHDGTAADSTVVSTVSIEK